MILLSEWAGTRKFGRTLAGLARDTRPGLVTARHYDLLSTRSQSQSGIPPPSPPSPSLSLGYLDGVLRRKSVGVLSALAVMFHVITCDIPHYLSMLMRASRMTPPLLLLLLLLLCGERCEAAVWADEIGLDIVTPSTPSPPSSPSPTSPPPATNSAVESSDHLSNETRQLESIAFPVGIAIGAIGAAIWPSIFPGVTTTTTTQSSADSFGDSSVDSSGDIISISGTTSTTEKSTTTTFEPRTLLENYPDCGVKGSSTKVVGGTQVIHFPPSPGRKSVLVVLRLLRTSTPGCAP